MNTIVRYLKFFPARMAFWLLPLAIVHCRSSDDYNFVEQNQAPTQAASQTPGTPATTTNSNQTEGSRELNSINGFGDGADDNAVSSQDEVNYPILSFTGRGNLDHRNGSASVMQKFSASMNKSTLTVTVQQFVAEGGDNKSDVNKEINKQTGDTVYSRTSNASNASSLTASDEPLFLIFSRSFEDRRGGTPRQFEVTSGDALPVLVIPAAESRYEILSKAALQFQSKLSSNGQNFTVRTTVTGRKVSVGVYQVTIEYYIPEDQNGEFYGILPISKTTDYGIDLNSKRITSIDSRGTYNDEDSNKARAVNIAYQLCQLMKDGKTENVGTCQ